MLGKKNESLNLKIQEIIYLYAELCVSALYQVYFFIS